MNQIVRAIAATGVALSVCACSGGAAPGNPAAPTTVTPGAPTAVVPSAVNGMLTATTTGEPLSGTTIVAESVSAVTDGGGRYSLPLAAAGSPLRVTVLAAVPRVVWIQAGSATANLDAITGGAFDLGFYRQFARNGFEQPTNLQPLRRWIGAKRIYLKTVDEAGAPIPAKTLDMVEATVHSAVATWTQGRISVTVERGTGTRSGVAGWTTIQWPSTPNPNICGSAQVGYEGGTIDLQYYNTLCRSGDLAVAPRTIRHEIGHALGFWHTDNPADLMFGGRWSDGQLQPSARETHHAAVVYARPVGNMDPDADPLATPALQSMTAHCGIRAAGAGR